MQKFARNEAGIALPMAIALIVLVGVMGAGLLVFVMRDLEAVTTVNKGQRALDIADSGVEAARTKLLAEAYPSSYDADDTDSDDWISLACNNNLGWNPLPIPRKGFWNPDYGIKRAFDGGEFRVEMRYLSPISSDDRCRSPLSVEDDSKYKEVDEKTFPTPRINAGYYKVTATACYPGGIDNTGDDVGRCLTDRAAKRKIEAVFRTRKLDVPMAIYTQSTDNQSVVIKNQACVQDINVFTMAE